MHLKESAAGDIISRDVNAAAQSLMEKNAQSPGAFKSLHSPPSKKRHTHTQHTVDLLMVVRLAPTDGTCFLHHQSWRSSPGPYRAARRAVGLAWLYFFEGISKLARRTQHKKNKRYQVCSAAPARYTHPPSCKLYSLPWVLVSPPVRYKTSRRRLPPAQRTVEDRPGNIFSTPNF